MPNPSGPQIVALQRNRGVKVVVPWAEDDSGGLVAEDERDYSGFSWEDLGDDVFSVLDWRQVQVALRLKQRLVGTGGTTIIVGMLTLPAAADNETGGILAT